MYKNAKNSSAKEIHDLEVSKFMQKYTNSQLPATFNNHFKFFTDVQSYNTRQLKTRQFALSTVRSRTGAKMIKYSAIETWSSIPVQIKNNTCLAL